MTTAANPQIVAPLAHCLADAPGRRRERGRYSSRRFLQWTLRSYDTHRVVAEALQVVAI